MKAMVDVPGGTFLMGSEDFYPEEAPVHRVTVGPFLMDEHPVTVAEFRRFVKATGYVTVAERAPDPEQFPDTLPELLVPGSLVFRKATGPVNLRDVSTGGPTRRARSGVTRRARRATSVDANGTATHVAFEDAEAYAAWAGKALRPRSNGSSPHEVDSSRQPSRGERVRARGQVMANTWQGEFPWQNLRTDGFEGTSPVSSFPPNAYGLHDMAGNVWEWTADYFASRRPDAAEHACCAPGRPCATTAEESMVAEQPGADMPRRVIKGGSHLCAPNYCLRYRPAARQSETVDTSTAHLGFRCVVRP